MLDRLYGWLRTAAAPGGGAGLVSALSLVVAVAVTLMFVRTFIDLPPIVITFLIPVLVAAIRWGYLAAMLAMVAGAICAAFFFYKPFYSLAIEDPARRIGIVIFIVVSMVASHLAVRMRRESETVKKREREIRDLYAFSRRLASVHATSDIFDAIRKHLSTLVDREVVLFEPRRPGDGPSDRVGRVPQNVRDAASAVLAGKTANGVAIEDYLGNLWLVRAVSSKTPDLGAIAIDLGRRTPESEEEIRTRVEAVLHDAASTIEQLGLAHAIADARMRAESERFRDALIGSVSHELRTPLSSILGAATVLSNAPAIAGDQRLVALANVVRDESERLNNEIQNLLDATRISGEALQPKLEWAELADIVNAAVDRQRNRFGDHVVDIDLTTGIPLVQVDAVLIERALRQILANAVKYSRPGSRITIRASQEEGALALAVSDEGAGLSPDDSARLGERFFRGSRHIHTTPGPGLGFWIASAFVAANGGAIAATSAGENKGTTVTIRLPVTADAQKLESIASD